MAKVTTNEPMAAQHSPKCKIHGRYGTWVLNSKRLRCTKESVKNIGTRKYDNERGRSQTMMNKETTLGRRLAWANHVDRKPTHGERATKPYGHHGGNSDVPARNISPMMDRMPKMRVQWFHLLGAGASISSRLHFSSAAKLLIQGSCFPTKWRRI